MYCLQPVLSALGMLTTYMAVITAFGLCSAVGLLYGPVHNILPLLMIGLGVDDMFVIVQCWQNLDHQVSGPSFLPYFRIMKGANVKLHTRQAVMYASSFKGY